MTLKASCLTSWNIQNTSNTPAHKTGNNSFREQHKPAGTWNLYEDAGPGLRQQHEESGLVFFLLFCDALYTSQSLFFHREADLLETAKMKKQGPYSGGPHPRSGGN